MLTRVRQVTWLPRSSPDPSVSRSPSWATPSSVSLATIAAVPAAVVPCCDARTPSSLVNISALRLSLELSIDEMTVLRGGELTLAIGALWAGATPRVMAPTWTPRRR